MKQQLSQNKAKEPVHFHEKISDVLAHSLTEEQRFLQGILSGKIKTYSHEEVMADLQQVMTRGRM